ncbi:MAG TPA: hypothetical protein VG225_03450 [Terracidiphilus sp.]|jgi:hypothetical protein|nr:hypothetical protein [Terracidiphilus sp.]
MKSLHLHIDRIVVEGLSAADQRQFAAALEAQLRDLAGSGIANQLSGNVRRRMASLDAGWLRPGATPKQAAMQVVESIRQSIAAPQPGNTSGGPKKSRGSEARSHV